MQWYVSRLGPKPHVHAPADLPWHCLPDVEMSLLISRGNRGLQTDLALFSSTKLSSVLPMKNVPSPGAASLEHMDAHKGCE